MGFLRNKKNRVSDSKNKSVSTEIIPVSSDNEEELIAIFTAVISASYGTSTKCNLKVSSFKRIENSTPVWSTAGRI